MTTFSEQLLSFWQRVGRVHGVPKQLEGLVAVVFAQVAAARPRTCTSRVEA